LFVVLTDLYELTMACGYFKAGVSEREEPDVMKALYYLMEQTYETGQAVPVTGGQVMLA
jgi:hypothetical protein